MDLPVVCVGGVAAAASVVDDGGFAGDACAAGVGVGDGVGIGAGAGAGASLAIASLPLFLGREGGAELLLPIKLSA